MDQKNKTQLFLYATYRKLTAPVNTTHIDQKYRDGRKILHSNGNQRRTGISIQLPLNNTNLNIPIFYRIQQKKY